jgi:hypothetical protein
LTTSPLLDSLPGTKKERRCERSQVVHLTPVLIIVFEMLTHFGGKLVDSDFEYFIDPCRPVPRDVANVVKELTKGSIQEGYGENFTSFPGRSFRTRA